MNVLSQNLADEIAPTHEALLSDVITRSVVPALMANHQLLGPNSRLGLLHPSEADIRQLSALILGPDNADALEFIYSLRDRGVSLDDLHIELLEPTARYLGELWDVDQVDFIAVTLGVNRLQRIVHHFAELDQVHSYDEKRRALIMAAPGEDHSFGSQIVQKFMTAAGWHVLTLSVSDSKTIIDLVSREWLAVVGFSIGRNTKISSLRDLIGSIRKNSSNPSIGVMVGGPSVVEQPDLVERLGADGTAANAVSAVVLAKKLLAEGLLVDHSRSMRGEL